MVEWPVLAVNIVSGLGGALTGGLFSYFLPHREKERNELQELKERVIVLLDQNLVLTRQNNELKRKIRALY